jgi:hypothetical protein
LASTWIRAPKPGDIGRFISENAKLPRFVVVKADKNTQYVDLWYSGAAERTKVPWRSFIKQCTDTWEITIGEPPEWLKPGADFFLDQTITLFKISDGRGRRSWTAHEGHLNLKGYSLKVFSIRVDHVSCFVPDLKTFVLVPIKTVAEHGYYRRTVYDILNSEDDPFVDADDWAELFRYADD